MQFYKNVGYETKMLQCKHNPRKYLRSWQLWTHCHFQNLLHSIRKSETTTCTFKSLEGETKKINGRLNPKRSIFISKKALLKNTGTQQAFYHLLFKFFWEFVWILCIHWDGYYLCTVVRKCRVRWACITKSISFLGALTWPEKVPERKMDFCFVQNSRFWNGEMRPNLSLSKGGGRIFIYYTCIGGEVYMHHRSMTCKGIILKKWNSLI